MKRHLLCLLGILTAALLPSQAAFAAGKSEADSSDIEAKVNRNSPALGHRPSAGEFRLKKIRG